MRKVIAATLVAGAVAAPASLLATTPEHAKQPPKRNPIVSMVFTGNVTVGCEADTFTVDPFVRGSNRHANKFMERAGVEAISVNIGENTRLRGFTFNADSQKVYGKEACSDLQAGDRVRFVIRARKLATLEDIADLKAKWIKDFTANAPVVDEVPVEETPVEPPVA